MKRLLIVILCLFFVSVANAGNLMVLSPVISTAGCAGYDCSGVGSFIWECNSTTVGDTGFCPYGCSDNDTSATAAGGDESIADGLCSFNDASANGGDYYYFDSPSTTIDDEGTVFVKFRVNTAWVDSARLFTLRGGNTDYIMIRCYTVNNNMNLVHSGNNNFRQVSNADNHIAVNTWYIAKGYWKVNEAGNDLRLTVYNSTGTELEDDFADRDLSVFNVQPSTDDLEIGQSVATPTGIDIDIEYIHFYEGNVGADPNGEASDPDA